MMLQEGGSPQTEQQMSEMIKENLTLSVKKGKKYPLNKYSPPPLSNVLFQKFLHQVLKLFISSYFSVQFPNRPVKTLRNKVYLIIFVLLQIAKTCV